MKTISPHISKWSSLFQEHSVYTKSAVTVLYSVQWGVYSVGCVHVGCVQCGACTVASVYSGVRVQCGVCTVWGKYSGDRVQCGDVQCGACTVGCVYNVEMYSGV